MAYCPNQVQAQRRRNTQTGSSWQILNSFVVSVFSMSWHCTYISIVHCHAFEIYWTQQQQQQQLHHNIMAYFPFFNVFVTIYMTCCWLCIAFPFRLLYAFEIPNEIFACRPNRNDTKRTETRKQLYWIISFSLSHSLLVNKLVLVSRLFVNNHRFSST